MTADSSAGGPATPERSGAGAGAGATTPSDRLPGSADARDDETRVLDIFCTSPVAMVIARRSDRTMVDVNAEFSRITGWSREEVLGRSVVELGVLDEETAARLRQMISAQRGLRDVEATIRTRAGEERTVLLGTSVLQLQGVEHSVTSFTDITARREAEQHLRQLNRTYALLSDTSQLIVREREPRAILDGVCRIAAHKGGFLMAWVGLIDSLTGDLRVTAHAGASPDTLLVLRQIMTDPSRGCAFTAEALATGRPAVCNDIEHDPRSAPWRAEALQRGYHSMVSLPLAVGGQRVGTINLYAGPVAFFDDDELRLLDELANDIAFALEAFERERERQRVIEALRVSQEELRQNEERFRLLIESASDLITIVNNEGVIRFESPSVEPVLGFRPDEMVGHSTFEYIHPDDAHRVVEALARATADPGTQVSVEFRHRHRDGRYRILQSNGRSVPGQAEEGFVVVNSRDLTEGRQLEEQFRQAQKMEAIGQLAGGVAHDFNNILAVVLMQAELTSTLEGVPESAREGLWEIKAAAERAGRLTRQLLLVSRRQVMQPRELDLNDTVTSLATMLRRIVGEDVQLQLNLHSRPLHTRADPAMIDQAMINLVVNARDAMPTGGRLVIETGPVHVSAEEARAFPDAVPGAHVAIRVTDSGIGIAAETMSHIFEPFFTTKEAGKGTGLGLATVFGIVRQHRGVLRVSSVEQHGATFEILLPMIEGTIPSRSDSSARLRWLGGSETILVVEDDPAVRASTRAVLSHQGYRVLEAEHGPDALRVWDAHDGPIHLVLTDIVMPAGMSGRDLADTLKQRDAELRIIFTSGYSADMAGREFVLDGGQEFLQKPCPPHQLLEAVRRCLDARP